MRVSTYLNSFRMSDHIYSTFWPMDSPHGSHHITLFLHSFSLNLVQVFRSCLKLFLGHKPWISAWQVQQVADPNCRFAFAKQLSAWSNHQEHGREKHKRCNHRDADHIANHHPWKASPNRVPDGFWKPPDVQATNARAKPVIICNLQGELNTII